MLRRRLECQRKMMVEAREKKEIKASWTSHCRVRKRNMGFWKKVRIGGIKGTMVAKVTKMGGENPWQKGSGNKGGKEARERWQGRRQNLFVGRVERQDT